MAAKFVIKKSDKTTSQPYWFVLKASNGEMIAQSEMYSSKQACKNGISSVKENAPTAIIDDETVE